jgi:hypothetical protein
MADKQRRIKLKNPRDIKRFLAKLLNQLYRKEIDPEIARDAGYLAKILLDCIEKVDLQEEIERIKKKLGIGNETQERTDPH